MFLQSKRKVVYWFTNAIRPHANVNKHFSFTVWPFLSYKYFTFPRFYLLSFSVCFFQLKITFYLPLLHSLNASLPCFICLSFLVRFLLSLLLLPRSLSPLLLPSFWCSHSLTSIHLSRFVITCILWIFASDTLSDIPFSPSVSLCGAWRLVFFLLLFGFCTRVLCITRVFRLI